MSNRKKKYNSMLYKSGFNHSLLYITKKEVN
jgi:hypothetical protein